MTPRMVIIAVLYAVVLLLALAISYLMVTGGVHN